METVFPALSPCLCPNAHLPESLGPSSLRLSQHRKRCFGRNESWKRLGKSLLRSGSSSTSSCLQSSETSTKEARCLMQIQPRDCACHYQSLLGCSGPKLPNPSTPPKCLPNPGPGPAQSHCKLCPLPDSQVPSHPRAPKCLPPSRVLTLQEYY